MSAAPSSEPSVVAPVRHPLVTVLAILLIILGLVLGGLGNMRGSVIAAALLTVLPELLRQFSDYRMLIYAIVLILVMIFTNNPQLKAFFGRVKDRFASKKEVAADAQ